MREMATTTKHTPGQWEVRAFPTASYGRKQLWVMDAIPDQDGKVVANAICMVSASNPSEEANAKLLAAAPDLLEACKAALKQMTNDWYGKPRIGMEKECAMCEAAIAKATKGNQ